MESSQIWVTWETIVQKAVTWKLGDKSSWTWGLYSCLVSLTLLAHCLVLTVGCGPHSYILEFIQKPVFVVVVCLFEFCFEKGDCHMSHGWPEISYVAQLAASSLQSSWLWSTEITEVCTWGLLIKTSKDPLDLPLDHLSDISSRPWYFLSKHEVKTQPSRGPEQYKPKTGSGRKQPPPFMSSVC